MRHSKFYSSNREHSKTFTVIHIYVLTLDAFVIACTHWLSMKVTHKAQLISPVIAVLVQWLSYCHCGAGAVTAVLPLRCWCSDCCIAIVVLVQWLLYCHCGAGAVTVVLLLWCWCSNYCSTANSCHLLLLQDSADYELPASVTLPTQSLTYSDEFCFAPPLHVSAVSVQSDPAAVQVWHYITL